MSEPTTTDRMEKIFHDLSELLETGQFTRTELHFMEMFLEQSLAATRKVKERAEKK